MSETEKQVVEHTGTVGVVANMEATIRSRRGGGGKLARSEMVSVRLDPRLRYLAELAARKQRRTVSSFIEWSIEDTLNRIIIYEGTGHNGDNDMSIAEDALYLWDVDEADRFVKLASRYQALLTHDEQILWKLIRENGWLWRGHYGKNDEWTWTPHYSSIILERLRESWLLFKAVAEGEADRDVLPKWEKTNPDTPPF
jgi:hypothetical protein